MIDPFYECGHSNVASYADDTTWYSCASDITSVVLELQASVIKLFRWFNNNHLKANPGKSHILPTILAKICGTNYRNTVKLDNTSKMQYLILRVFLTVTANI